MQMSKLTLGSLFDGSGGFPLGGLLCGIEPLWASEIEPFPIRVTTKRIPQMKHYGDINKLNGAELPPVDIITFGSPCTDMSVAGKRAGLDGEQSVLFYEAIRIIKEMRCKTNGQYPRYAVWENVPGAFSSNKGEDFRAVLEAVIGVKEPNTSVPLPEKGRWPYADIYMADGWSVAYRTIDAQYFGVPQRRRRIYLVADFAGRSAAEILFESEGMPRNFTPSGSPWQRTSGNAKNCTGKTGTVCLNDQGGQRIDVLDGKTATLRAKANHPPCVMFENHSQDTRYKGPVDVAPTVSATYGKGGNNQPFVTTAGFCTEHSSDSRSIGYEEEISPTLRAGVVPAAVSLNETPKTLKIRSGCEGGGKGALIQDDKSATLGCNNDQTVFVPTAFGICSDKSNSMQSSNPHSGIYEADTSRTIDANGGNPGCNQGGIAVVALQGSMIGRQDKNGPQGDGINDNMSFTLNTVDRHGVVYAIDRETFNCGQNFARNLGITEDSVASTLNAQGPSAVAQPYQNVSGTISAGAHPSGFNGQDASNDMLVTVKKNDEPEYIVRRLTPTECARLQGFPDDWCDDLGTENPTEDEILFWTEVWETHRKIMGKSSKPKTRNQIIKWLNNPHSDSAEYKMWGNGVALPCVCFVLTGIVLSAENTAE